VNGEVSKPNTTPQTDTGAEKVPAAALNPEINVTFALL